ncbi:MAG: DEAD/DEAH box helicase [Sphaerochaetaceae bacterium]|nr:DEAD/DEAH box helicase [Sphaerochaetaceae bacterium]
MNKQEQAFKKLSKLKVGMLAMEMGTGKTKVALDLMASKLHKVDYMLWICPFSIKSEIEAERIKWHPELTVDIVGVETISASDRVYLGLLENVKTHKTFIVVDESLKIKNLDAKRTKRILEFGEYAQYKLILNGTPLSKNVLDLYTQLQFLSPKILNMSFNQFKNQYCEYYVRGELKGVVKKQHNIEHLISIIEPYIFDAELDLGKLKHYIDVDYYMTNHEDYEEIKYNFITGNDSDIEFFALANALQHFYCSQEKKAKLVDDIAERLDGQVLVFVKYLDSIPESARCITGDTKDRKCIIKDFKDGKFKTLYITYGCGAFGLNFQNCNNMIFADHTFNYAERLQAEARIFRIGQDQDVNYYNINCNVGLDRLIRKCLNKKTKLLDEVKTEITRVGVEEWVKTI